MKILYKAENNYTNYLIIEDTEVNRSRVFDWDLSADEINDFTARFERGEITDVDAASDEWESGDGAFSGLFAIQQLACTDL